MGNTVAPWCFHIWKGVRLYDHLDALTYAPLEDEQWASIPDWPMYSISTHGRIRNERTNHIRMGSPNGEGYLTVRLSAGMSRQATPYVHRLVAAAFHPNWVPESSVRFRNDNIKDCRLDNLLIDPHLPKVYRTSHRRHASRVKVVELGLVFRNAEAAAAHIKGDSNCIYRCLRGEQNRHLGYTFERVTANEALRFVRWAQA